MATQVAEQEIHRFVAEQEWPMEAVNLLLRTEERGIDARWYDYMFALLDAGYPAKVVTDETLRRAGFVPAVHGQTPLWPLWGVDNPSPKTMWATGERPMPTGNGKEYAAFYLKNMARAIQHTRNMPLNARKVGVVLYNEAAKHGNRNMLGASSWLGELSGLSTDQVDRAVKWLQGAGWLKVVKSGKTMLRLDSELARYRYNLPMGHKPRFIHLELQPPRLPDRAGVAA